MLWSPVLLLTKAEGLGGPGGGDHGLCLWPAQVQSLVPQSGPLSPVWSDRGAQRQEQALSTAGCGLRGEQSRRLGLPSADRPALSSGMLLPGGGTVDFCRAWSVSVFWEARNSGGPPLTAADEWTFWVPLACLRASLGDPFYQTWEAAPHCCPDACDRDRLGRTMTSCVRA